MRSLITVLALCLMLAAIAAGQEPSAKKRHALPTGWSKTLQLTPAQKQAIYKVQDEHATKIADLQRQIAELRAAERAAIVQTLTDEQKQRLLRMYGVSK